MARMVVWLAGTAALALLGPELAEKPLGDSVLFLGQERRHRLYRCVKRSAHDTNHMRNESGGQAHCQANSIISRVAGKPMGPLPGFLLGDLLVDSGHISRVARVFGGPGFRSRQAARPWRRAS